MRDEGYIKYHTEMTGEFRCPGMFLDQLNSVRTTLHTRGLIGMYDDGIGYGNISMRSGTGFIISASATGSKKILDSGEYVHVHAVDIDRNTVFARGMQKPSSESLTHGAIYAACEEARAVIHVHSRELFDYLAQHPDSWATSRGVAYGTPEMARAISDLVTHHGACRIFYTPGHDEGVFAYGRTLQDAETTILELYEKAVKA
ncbi:MAG: class II aldolase/adducin family protein [Fibrobacterota bacterium]